MFGATGTTHLQHAEHSWYNTTERLVKRFLWLVPGITSVHFCLFLLALTTNYARHGELSKADSADWLEPSHSGLCQYVN